MNQRPALSFRSVGFVPTVVKSARVADLSRQVVICVSAGTAAPLDMMSDASSQCTSPLI